MVRPSGPSGSVLGKTIAMLGKQPAARGLSVSHPCFIVVSSRITSRPAPASFGPQEGIIFIKSAPLAGPAERVLTNGKGVGPAGEESPRFSRVSDGFRGVWGARERRVLRWK